MVQNLGVWGRGTVVLVVVMAVIVGCKAPKQAAGPTRVTIASAPESGAHVVIGGIAYGETPVTVTGLAKGNVLVVLTRDGYKRATQTIEIPPVGDERIVIGLEPLTGLVSFESIPAGAQVFLDGTQYLGDTPISLKPVIVGHHTYELRKENYKPLTGAMDIRQDYRYTFPHEFIPKDARLSIFSRPTGAKIWIDDELQIQTTPAKFELAPADYSVKVHAKGYLMGEENVTLGPNEERGIELVLKEGDVPPGMVLIPAGRFLMGVNGASPDERPLRQVEVNAFYIDKSEVTNEQFKAVFPQHTFPKGKQLFPVRGISFKQATEYAQAIGKRLPAEEEWEKAARGTDGREYPWGMEFNKDFCNFDDSEAGDVMKVGRFKLGASPYGCLDMAGNVYEWTSSWYQAYPGNADVTKDYGQIFRVLRGGSYRSDRFGVRCARRYYDRMDAVRDDYGLRCAKDVGGGP